MEPRPSLSAKDRRTLLRGGVLAATVSAVSAQSADAQANCPTGVIITDARTGKFEAAQVPDPVRSPGNRRSISPVVEGDGQNAVRIPVQDTQARVSVLKDGRRGVANVEIYDYEGASYIRNNNQPLQLELPCYVYVNLTMNRRLAPGSIIPVPETPTLPALPGGNPDSRVIVTATPTPTARVETPTPTHTPVVHTPTPTETPNVVTATPTETPFVVTATPTPTSERPTATATPALPPTFDRDRGFLEGVWCAGPIAVVGLGAAVLFAANRGHDR